MVRRTRRKKVIHIKTSEIEQYGVLLGLPNSNTDHWLLIVDDSDDVTIIGDCDIGCIKHITNDSRNVEIVFKSNYRGHLIRSGRSDGNITRSGDGAGYALRRGVGKGDAIRDGKGAGSAIRDGPGDGDAIRKGGGVGSAIRKGTGNGLSCIVGENELENKINKLQAMQKQLKLKWGDNLHLLIQIQGELGLLYDEYAKVNADVEWND